MKIVEQLAQIIANAIIPIRDELNSTKATLEAIKQNIGWVDTDGDLVPDDQDALPNDPNVGENVAYYTYSTGQGYYWPVYFSQTGLGDSHSHVLNNGRTYYMPDSVLVNGTEGVDYAHGSVTPPADSLELLVDPYTDTAPIDADYDGVEDDTDYFPYNSDYAQTQAILDGYLLDTYKSSLEVGDIVKIVSTDYLGNAGNYKYISSITSTSAVLTSPDGTTINAFLTDRGSIFEVVNPSDVITPDPNRDTDGDGTIDTEDYFPLSSTHSLTQAELDGWALDVHNPSVEVNQIVKVLTEDYLGSVGTYYYVVSVNGDDVSLGKPDGSTASTFASHRGSVYEIINHPSNLYPEPDTDNDGVADSLDYWPTKVFMTQTKAELDTYLADPFKEPDLRDVIRVLDTIEANYYGSAGDYLFVESVYAEAPFYKFVKSNGDTIYSNPGHTRGTHWEVVTDPSLPRTPNPDQDGDGVNDDVDYFLQNANYTQSQAELDAYEDDIWKQPAVGDLVKISAVTAYGGTGEYVIITSVDSTNVSFEGADGIVHTGAWVSERATFWEIVNPSGSLTPAPDADGDGVPDHLDAFENDPTQTTDTDGDGYGDNPDGNNPDAFPNDSTQWVDSDGDGYGDNPDGNNPDAFPNDPNENTDTDGDGVGDNADAYPEDPNLTETPSIWSPTNATLVAWYDPSSGNAYEDKSGNGYDLSVSPTSANRTIAPVNLTHNGLGVFNYGLIQTAHSLENDNFAYDLTANPLVISMLVHLSADADSSKAHFLWELNEDYQPNTSVRTFCRRLGTNSLQLLGGDNSSSLAVQTPSGQFTSGNTYVATFVLNGTNSSIRLNGTEVKSGTTLARVTQSLNLGCNVTESQSLQGYIGETIFYSSLSDIETIEGYIAHKWGESASLPSTHPYKTSSPNSLVDSDGDGVIDAEEYFYLVPDTEYTYEQLEAYPVGSTSTYTAPNGIIKYNGPSTDGFVFGDYYIITSRTYNPYDNVYEYQVKDKRNVIISTKLIGSWTGGTNDPNNPLTNWVTKQVPLDSDGDGSRDDADYFSGSEGDNVNNEWHLTNNYTQTKEEFDTWVEDSETSVVIGDVIRMIDGNLSDHVDGEYYIVKDDTRTGPMSVPIFDLYTPLSEYDTYVHQPDRGTRWIKIKEPPPMVSGYIVSSATQYNDSDSDSVSLSRYIKVPSGDGAGYYKPTLTAVNGGLGLWFEQVADLNHQQVQPSDRYSFVYISYQVGDMIFRYLYHMRSTSFTPGQEPNSSEYVYREIYTSPYITGFANQVPDKFDNVEDGVLYEIGDLVDTDDDGIPDIAEIPDTDSDGVADDTDYFVNDASYPQTLAELENDYADDPYYQFTTSTPTGILLKVISTDHWASTAPDLGEFLIYRGQDPSTGNHRYERGDGSYVETFSNILYYGPLATWPTLMKRSLPGDLSPVPDADGDGVGDYEDYFKNNANYAYTTEQLNGYARNSLGRPEQVGDIIVSKGPNTEDYFWSSGAYAIIRQVNGPYTGTDSYGNPITYYGYRIWAGRDETQVGTEFFGWGNGTGGLGTALSGASASPQVNIGKCDWATIGRP